MAKTRSTFKRQKQPMTQTHSIKPDTSSQQTDSTLIAEDRFYRRSEVVRNRYFGCGNTALQEMIDSGQIDPPVKMGRRMTGWFGRYIKKVQRAAESKAQQAA